MTVTALARGSLLGTFVFVSTAAYPATTFVESTMHPGEKLVIGFSFSEAPVTNVGAVDFLQFAFGGSFTDFFTEGRNSFYEAKLYDGETLLGVGTILSSGSGCCIYSAAGSPGAGEATAQIDITSIRDGTIDGRLEFVPYFDQPSQFSEVFLTWSMRTGTYVGPGAFWEGTPDPTVQSVAVVPLPAALWLFILGTAGVGNFISFSRNAIAQG